MYIYIYIYIAIYTYEYIYIYIYISTYIYIYIYIYTREDEDEYGDELMEPPPEVIDEWEQDEIVKQIMENFQSEEVRGKDSMKLRDVYKLLEVLGIERNEFVALFTMDYDDDSDDDDYFEEQSCGA